MSIKAVGNFLQIFSYKITSEYLTHQGCLLFIDGNLSINQSVSIWHGWRQVGTIFHPPLNTPSEVVRDILALFLVHHGENGGQELTGQFRGVGALLLEAHPHPQGLQFPDSLQALFGVPGKPGGGLHKDLVHPAPAAVCQQPLEVVPLLRRGAGDPLVRVHVHELPLRVGSDELRVVGVLGGKGVELIL